MNRLTPHTDCISAGAFARDFLDSSSSVMYYLDASPAQIDAALQRGKVVINRVYDPFNDYAKDPHFDNQFHEYHTPNECIQYLNSHWARYRDNPNAFFIVGWNELSNFGRDDIRSQMRWFGELIDNTSRWSFAIGGWNTSKTIRMVDDGTGRGRTKALNVDRGIWDSLLERAHKHRDRIILDFHAYTIGRAWLIRTGGDPDNIQALQNRPTAPLRWDAYPDGTHAQNWHIGREAPLVDRARRNGWNVRFGIGEGFHDHMQDVLELKQELRSRFGMERFMNDIRGIRSVRRFYAYINQIADDAYDSVQFGDDAYQDGVYIDDMYPNEFEYLTWYAANNNPDWKAYNIAHPEMFQLIKRLKQHNSEDYMSNPLPTYPTPAQWIKIVLKRPYNDGAGTNIRPNYQLGTNVVDSVDASGTDAYEIAVDDNGNPLTVDNDGYRWYMLRLEQSPDTRRYIASRFATYEKREGDDGEGSNGDTDNGGEDGTTSPGDEKVFVDVPLPNFTTETTRENAKLLRAYVDFCADVFTALAIALDENITPVDRDSKSGN